MIGKTSVRVLAATGVAVMGLAACGSSGSSSTSSASSAGMKIGFFGALTGPNAQLGINIDNGEKLAIQQYDATNPKVKITIDPFDSQGLPAQAPQGVQKMIADNVVALIGPAFSSESQSADPTLEKAGIPNISASATNVKLAQNGLKFFHRALADDSAQGPGDADYIVKTLGDKTVAVIDDSSSYGQGLADFVRSSLKTNGGGDALDDHIDPNGQDYSSTVNKIVAAKPSAVFFGGYYDAAGRLAKQLKDAGYKGAFVSGDGSKDPGFIKSAGSPATAEGAYLSCACEDTTASSAAQAFNAAYMKAYGTPPQTYSGEAYDATNFILAAIKSGATTKTAINNYLGSNQWVGVTKTLKFLPNGNVSGGTVYMYQVKNGNIVQVGTTS